MRSKRTKVIRVAAQDLKVHPFAQRQLSPAGVKRVMATLDLDAIGLVDVVDYPINGEAGPWIVDGQHRREALIRHGLGEWILDCRLHEDVADDARASELFLLLNTTTPVASYDKFANRVRAGHPGAVGAVDVARRSGFKVDRQVRDGHIACVNVLEKLWSVDDGVLLHDVLDIASRSWGQTSSAVEGKLIAGLAKVCQSHNGELDRSILVKKLAKYPGGAPGILGDAKGLHKLRRGALAGCVAEVITEAYNRNRRTNRLS